MPVGSEEKICDQVGLFRSWLFVVAEIRNDICLYFMSRVDTKSAEIGGRGYSCVVDAVSKMELWRSLLCTLGRLSNGICFALHLHPYMNFVARLCGKKASRQSVARDSEMKKSYSLHTHRSHQSHSTLGNCHHTYSTLTVALVLFYARSAYSTYCYTAWRW